MLYEKELKLKYITDNRGRKRSVILPIKKFNEIMEDLEDIVVAAERKEESTLSHTKLIHELKKMNLYKIRWKTSASKELRKLPK